MKFKTVTLFIITLCLSSNVFSQNKLDNQGKKHGKWIGYYENSKNIRYEGTFEHGIEKDTFKFYDNTKTKTINAIRIFSEDGQKAYTKFYNGKFLVSEGAEINRKREGIWKYYHYNSTQIMTIEPYKDNLIEGLRAVYYPNGLVAETCNYTKGKKEGEYRRYAVNKVVIEESFYINDQLEGNILVRNPEGQIITKGKYKKGLPIGIWEYYQNGKLLKKVDKDKELNPSDKVVTPSNKTNE